MKNLGTAMVMHICNPSYPGGEMGKSTFHTSLNKKVFEKMSRHGGGGL
jgi:hypothetical protein